MNKIQQDLLVSIITRLASARPVFVQRHTIVPELVPDLEEFAGALAAIACAAPTVNLEALGLRLPWNARFIEPSALDHSSLALSCVTLSPARLALVYVEHLGVPLGGGGWFELHFRMTDKWEILRTLPVWRG